MALTARQLLDRLFEMEGTDFATVQAANEKRIRSAVAEISAAIRWFWYPDDPLMAFPCTVASATVTVTAGKIDPNDLGDGTGCSLWEADPRPLYGRGGPVGAQISEVGVHPDRSLTSVFAFFRYSAPQLTYAEGGAYALPSNIPNALQDIVPLRALSQRYVAMQQWDALNALKKLYGEPEKMKDALSAALQNSGLAWQDHWLALSPAANAGAVIPGIVEISNNYMAVRMADGVIRYFVASNDMP